MKVRRHCLLGLAFTFGCICRLSAQNDASDLKIFGYFQPQFYYESDAENSPEQNSFVLQQLNVFFQKDLSRRLTSFVNFEGVNSFSSDQKWGSFRLEEAWVRYRHSRNLNVRLGLQIPIFNNLNEIKNRMPVIPYVIRPLVYESSFVDVIPIRYYVPQQAYAQVFGWLPAGEMKIDYAAYLGNTELVNSGFNVGSEGRPIGQTGVDTTMSVLVGGRVGMRYGELKAGFSATSDRSAIFQGVGSFTGLKAEQYLRVPRRRYGADLSYYLERFSFEGELIKVVFDKPERVDLDLSFYYFNLGYRVTDRLLVYGGYWLTRQKTRILRNHEIVEVRVPDVGVAYMLEDQITLKAQYAHVGVDNDYSFPDQAFKGTSTFDYATVAVSVTF